MALSLQVRRALALFPGKVFLQWDLDGATESGSYVFEVSRGPGPEGPWEVLVAGQPDTYNHLDTLPQQRYEDVNLLTLARDVHYRIRVTPPQGPAYAAEAVTVLEPKLEGRFKLLKRKILRDEAVLLRRLNGVEVAVLKRVRWGERCTKCYDKYTREPVRGACTQCYGTGYRGGYHPPVVTLARRGVTPVNTQVTPQGKTDVILTQVTMLDVPAVEQDDVLVFLRDNRRFIVKEVTHTEIQTVTVHQKLGVSELARNTIEYRIPVDPKAVPPLF